MAKLYFDIGANYSEAERLTKVCKTLEERITSLQGSADPTQIQAWTLQLAAAQKRLSSIAVDAAKAGKAFQDIDVEELQKSFDTVAQDPKAIKNLEKGLKNVAKAYESELKQAQKRMEQFGRDANKAMKRGDAQGYDTATKGIAAEQEKMTMLGENISSVNDALKILGGEANKDTGIIERLLGGTENYNKAIKEMPASMRKATVATNGLTKGMKAFMAVPIVAVISAIALAFAAFKKWLNSTEEGEMLLAKATGVLKGVMVTLENIAVRVGQALYDAFSNPKETIAALGKAIQEDIIDRFTPLKDKVSSLIKFVKTVLSKDGGIKKAVDELVAEWDAANEIKEQNRQERREERQERRDNRKEQVRKFIDEAKNNITESQRIELDRLQLSEDKSDWEVKSERNEAKMVQLQDIYQNSSLNSDIRSRALEAYMKILKEQTSGDEGIAGREADLIRREQALSVGGTSAEAATLNSAYANLEKVRAKGERQMKAANKAMFSIIKEGEKEGEVMQRMSLDEWENELNLQEDSTQKKLDLLEITYQRTLENIAQQAETWRNANGDLLSDEERELVRSLFPDISDEEFEKTFGGLTVAQAAAIDKMGIIAVKTLKKGREDIGKAVYESYKSEEDQKKDLEKAYLEDVAALETAYNETGDEKFKRSIEERTKAYKASLKKIEDATDSTLKLIFGDIDLMSKSTLDEAIEKAKERLADLLKDPTTNASDISAVRSQLDNLISARTNYDFAGWGGSLTDLLRIGSRKESLQAQKDKDDEALKGIEEGTDEYKNLLASIDLADKGLKKLTEDQKKAAAAFAASELGKNLEKIGSALREIGELTEDNTASDLGEAFSEVGGVVSNIANGFATGGIWGGIAAAAGTVVDKVMEAVVSAKVADAEFKRMTSDFESRLEMLKLKSKDYSNIFGVDSMKQSQEAYANAAKALSSFVTESNKLKNESFKSKDYSWWSNLFGKGDVYSSLKDFDIWGEDGLLNPDKAREFLSVWGDKLSESQRTQIEHALELKDAYDELTDTVKDYVGSLTGASASDLAGEMVDKFIRTGSAILDMSDNMNSFKRKMAESRVEALLMEKVFTQEAQDNITKLLMGNDVNGAIEAYNKLLDEANSMSGEIEMFLSGVNAQAIEDQKATGGGFQTMNQDTGTELNGRFTALQISGENIEASMNDIAANFTLFSERFASQLVAIDDIRNIQAQSLIELQGINENTLLALKPIREMNATLGEIKTKVDTL